MGYTVIGLDIDGFDVAGGNEWDTFREADKAARRLMTDREAIGAGMHKVEIHNRVGECVRDYFVKQQGVGNHATGRSNDD